VTLLGLVLLVASCAVTPPVLGGPSPAPGTDGRSWTDEDVAELLILDDPESENVVLPLAEYLADVVADSPGVDPAACADSVAPLLLRARDASASGSVVVSPPLFRDAPGADLLVAQSARRFASAAEARAFGDALRAARDACPVLTTVDGARTDRASVDGALGVAAVGFASTTTGSDGSVVESFEWMLVHAEVAVSLSAVLSDEDDRSILDDLAAEYVVRLTGAERQPTGASDPSEARDRQL